MSRLHITDDGRILSCSAETEACKYAKNETAESPRHFEIDQMEMAEKQREVFMAKKHGHLPKKTQKVKIKARKKSNVVFETSQRSQEIESNLINDRFARTPNPNTLLETKEFDAFRNALASV